MPAETQRSRDSGGGPRYAGPIPVITTAEAASIVALLRGRPELADLAQRLRAAIGADAIWREPHP